MKTIKTNLKNNFMLRLGIYEPPCPDTDRIAPGFSLVLVEFGLTGLSPWILGLKSYLILNITF